MSALKELLQNAEFLWRCIFVFKLRFCHLAEICLHEGIWCGSVGSDYFTAFGKQKHNWSCGQSENFVPCFLCHPEEKNRSLVGEGWVAAGPLRGLFLQGHTHAWSEAVAHGDCIWGPQLRYRVTEGDSKNYFWSKDEHAALFLDKLRISKSSSMKVTLLYSPHPLPTTKENLPFFKWISLKSIVIMNGCMQCRHPYTHCKKKNKTTTFLHICFNKQIVAKESWKCVYS